jgi:hypothetical protein
MHTTFLKPTIMAAAAILAVAALSGCSSPTPVHTSTHNHAGSGNPGQVAKPPKSATPTPTPTPTSKPTPKPAGPPPLPANALFSISATVTASNGATADLLQIVYKPIAQDAAEVALLNSQCNYPGQPDFQGQPTWQAQYPNSKFMDISMTATLHPGSPAFLAGDAVNFGFGGGVSAYSGAYQTFEAYCSPGYITIPGTITGVATVPASDPAHALWGWASNPAQYGFDGGGDDPGEPDSGGTAVVSNCVVQLSADAKAAGGNIAAWATQPYAKVNGCDYRA